MRMTILGLAVMALFVAAIAFSQNEKKPTGVIIEKEKVNPWTDLALRNNPQEFQFAIVSDRTGGHRAKIFSRAVARLNLLQPEFVLSVGDLIEGGNKKPEQLAAEWKEFDGYVQKLQMPFFYVPGNHDTGNATSDKVWQERYGRRWYNFTYRGVLFLCLDTDDPPGSSSMSKEQADFAKKVLADNQDVRHTIVALHKPIWTYTKEKTEHFREIEKALADRPYTVFCGHVHRYQKFVRQGRSYYQLATTGGGSRLRGLAYGEFDQIVWVTMKKEGPVFANVLLDSVLPDDLKVPDSAEKGVNRTVLKTQPVRGVAYYDGAPLVGAHLTFTRTEPVNKSTTVSGIAMTEGDGSFRVSTYTAFDGLPEGKYEVTVIQRRPLYNQDGTAGPNVLPTKYATGKTSGLTIEVTKDMGEVKLELTK